MGKRGPAGLGAEKLPVTCWKGGLGWSERRVQEERGLLVALASMHRDAFSP